MKGAFIAAGAFILIVVVLLAYKVVIPKWDGASMVPGNEPSPEARQRVLNSLNTQATSTATTTHTTQSAKETQLSKLNAPPASSSQTQTQAPTNANMDAKMHALEQLNR